MTRSPHLELGRALQLTTRQLGQTHDALANEARTTRHYHLARVGEATTLSHHLLKDHTMTPVEPACGFKRSNQVPIAAPNTPPRRRHHHACCAWKCPGKH